MSHLRVTPLSDVVVFFFSQQKIIFFFLGASPDWILVVVVVVSNAVIQQGVYDCATTRARSPGSRTPGGSGTQSPRRPTTVDHRGPRKFLKKKKKKKIQSYAKCVAFHKKQWRNMSCLANRAWRTSHRKNSDHARIPASAPLAAG